MEADHRQCIEARNTTLRTAAPARSRSYEKSAYRAITRPRSGRNCYSEGHRPKMGARRVLADVLRTNARARPNFDGKVGQDSQEIQIQQEHRQPCDAP